MELLANNNNVAYNPFMADLTLIPSPDFAKLCKTLRAWKGLTQLEMAEFVGTDVRNYRRYEEGTRVPGGLPAYRLARLEMAYKLETGSL